MLAHTPTMSSSSGPSLQTHLSGDTTILAGGVAGDAVSLWFIPGFGATRRLFRPAFEHALARRHRLYLCDLPGHGGAPTPRRAVTMEAAATQLADAVDRHSGRRPVVLIAHSLGGLIASLAARKVQRAPLGLISIEGNLTPADAFFSGRAVRYQDPQAFARELCADVDRAAMDDPPLQPYAAGLRGVDPHALWSLGQSLADYPEPWRQYRAVPCATRYWFDRGSLSAASQAVIAEQRFASRSIDGLGHWPMVSDPVAFFDGVAEQVREFS